MAMYNTGLSAGGGEVEIDGVAYDGDLKLKKVLRNVKLEDMPFTYSTLNSLVLDNEIYFLVNTNSIYKFDGSTWTLISELTIPSTIAPVGYEGCIYTFSHSNYYSYAHRFDGSTWTQISMGKIGRICISTVFDGAIHIIGASSGSYTYGSAHKSYNGKNAPSTVSNLPYTANGDTKLLTYKDELHALSGTYYSNDYQKHYKFNGSTWTQVESITDTEIGKGLKVALEDAIHSLSRYGRNRYKYDGVAWNKVGETPYLFSTTSADGSPKIEVMNDTIYVFGGGAFLYQTRSSSAENFREYIQSVHKLDVPAYEIEQ